MITKFLVGDRVRIAKVPASDYPRQEGIVLGYARTCEENCVRVRFPEVDIIGSAPWHFLEEQLEYNPLKALPMRILAPSSWERLSF